MYALSAWGGKRSSGCRLSVGGWLECFCVGTGSLAGTRPAGGPAATLDVVTGVGAGVLDGSAAGEPPAATRCGVEGALTSTTFRSRDATAFETSAQTTAATIKVAASMKCLGQFIVGWTSFAARMLHVAPALSRRAPPERRFHISRRVAAATSIGFPPAPGLRREIGRVREDRARAMSC